MTSLLMSVMVMISVSFGASLLFHLPKALLGAIVITAAISLVLLQYCASHIGFAQGFCSAVTRMIVKRGGGSGRTL